MSVSVTTDVATGTAHALVEGRNAGRLGFRVREDGDTPVWVVYTTVVYPAFEGHGVGSALVADVIARADAAGALVQPTCWFVAGWLARHPEFSHLLPDDLH